VDEHAFRQLGGQVEVRERVNAALRTVEQERLAQAVQGAEAKRAPSSVLNAIYAGAERLGNRAARAWAEAHG
jgi:hypothetical protein